MLVYSYYASLTECVASFDAPDYDGARGGEVGGLSACEVSSTERDADQLASGGCLGYEGCFFVAGVEVGYGGGCFHMFFECCALLPERGSNPHRAGVSQAPGALPLSYPAVFGLAPFAGIGALDFKSSNVYGLAFLTDSGAFALCLTR